MSPKTAIFLDLKVERNLSNSWQAIGEEL